MGEEKKNRCFQSSVFILEIVFVFGFFFCCFSFIYHTYSFSYFPLLLFLFLFFYFHFSKFFYYFIIFFFSFLLQVFLFHCCHFHEFEEKLHKTKRCSLFKLSGFLIYLIKHEKEKKKKHTDIFILENFVCLRIFIQFISIEFLCLTIFI